MLQEHKEGNNFALAVQTLHQRRTWNKPKFLLIGIWQHIGGLNWSPIVAVAEYTQWWHVSGPSMALPAGWGCSLNANPKSKICFFFESQSGQVHGLKMNERTSDSSGSLYLSLFANPQCLQRKDITITSRKWYGCKEKKCSSLLKFQKTQLPIKRRKKNWPAHRTS